MSSTAKILNVKCPTCNKVVSWIADNHFKPFCSERCKMIDLGEWATEEKRIPGETVISDESNDENDFLQ